MRRREKYGGRIVIAKPWVLLRISDEGGRDHFAGSSPVLDSIFSCIPRYVEFLLIE